MQTWSTSVPNDTAPAEFALLLLCARTKLEEVDARRIEELLQQDVDWPRFVQQAIDHQVLPLVHRTLSGVPHDRIPQKVMGELQNLSGVILRHNLFLLSKLLQVVDLLGVHEIPMIPYKGPVVAALAYGNIGLRQFSDIDILVSPARYFQARDVLLENGYMLGREWGNEFALVHELDGAHLDLHRAIMPRRIPFTPDFDAYQQRLRPIVVAGRQIESLGPEDTLIMLCAQMVKDGSGSRPLPLIKICDIAELVRAYPDMDWQIVVREAKALGCTGIVSFGLSMARQLLQAPVPDLALPAASPRNLGILSRYVTDKLVNQWSPSYQDRLGAKRFHFKLRERWRDKLQPYFNDLRGAVTPNALDEEFLRLPRILWPLYLFVRPIRLLRDRRERHQRGAEGDATATSNRRNSDAGPGPDSSNQ